MRRAKEQAVRYRVVVVCRHGGKRFRRTLYAYATSASVAAGKVLGGTFLVRVGALDEELRVRDVVERSHGMFLIKATLDQEDWGAKVTNDRYEPGQRT